MQKVNTAYSLPSSAVRVGAPLVGVALVSAAHGAEVGGWPSLAAAVTASIAVVVIDQLWLGPKLSEMGYVPGYTLRALAQATAYFGVGVLSALAYLG